MKRILLVLASLLAASPLAFAADDSPIAGVGTYLVVIFGGEEQKKND